VNNRKNPRLRIIISVGANTLDTREKSLSVELEKEKLQKRKILSWAVGAKGWEKR
jgi:hypothetical protein